ncbi:MAG: tetratricopeptide repeat protein [Actinomycetales bacterium]|nr:tetratricopeptide repeat protein [Actinomycetales bacterium]
MAGRRLLVIADNAGDCEQVRLLLPGTPSSLLVATSRDSLGELVARDGAHRITLDLLSAADAAGLLGELVGERVCGEPEAVGVLVEQCSRLPLALRVAAELAVSRPDVSLGALVVELSDEEKRLDLMVADGDPRAGVEAVFSWSYRQLQERTARVFRRVGLHPGPSWGVCAAAALAGAGVGVEAVAGDLGVLVRAHLVQEVGRGRFVMHDLLRAYARGLVARADTEPERVGAVTALLDHVVASAACALDPSSTRRRPPRPTPVTALPLPEVPDAAGALGWLAVERPALVRLVVHAADNGWPAHAVHLAEILCGPLECGGHLVDALTVHEAALRAARATGDLTGQAHAHISGGVVLVHWGRYAESTRRLEEAAVCARRCGDAHLEARALNNTAVIAVYVTGRGEEAIALLHRALPLWRRTDDRLAEVRTLVNLGILESKRGRHEEGLAHLESAQAMALACGDRRVEAEARDGLGNVQVDLGRHAEAAEHLEVALEIWRECAAPESEARTQARLGVARTRLGRPEEALELLQAALDFYRRNGYRLEATVILNSIGTAHRVAGRPEEAAAWHTEALATAEDLNSIPERALAHDELGQDLAASGHDGQARSHWRKALALYEELGYPQARDVARRLGDAHAPGTDTPRIR